MPDDAGFHSNLGEAYRAMRQLPEAIACYHRALAWMPDSANGHTTSMDSFWMGVPVVTIVGQTVVGRAGVSLAQNLGLPELIAQTPYEFIRIAVALARDLPRLAKMRANLRERMRSSSLMDAPRFARDVKAAYRTMWQRWCAKELSGTRE